jgi:hypothetical protein
VSITDCLMRAGWPASNQNAFGAAADKSSRIESHVLKP